MDEKTNLLIQLNDARISNSMLKMGYKRVATKALIVGLNIGALIYTIITAIVTSIGKGMVDMRFVPLILILVSLWLLTYYSYRDEMKYWTNVDAN